MLNWFVVQLYSNNLVIIYIIVNLPKYPVPQSCMLRYHTHPEWNTDQSKSGGYTLTPVASTDKILHSYLLARNTSDGGSL